MGFNFMKNSGLELIYKFFEKSLTGKKILYILVLLNR